MAQALLGPRVGLGHDPEEPGPCSEQCIGNCQVGGQRHGRVVVLRLEARPKGDLVAPLGGGDHLLERLDSARAASVFGCGDAPGQLGEGIG